MSGGRGDHPHLRQRGQEDDLAPLQDRRALRLPPHPGRERGWRGVWHPETPSCGNSTLLCTPPVRATTYGPVAAWPQWQLCHCASPPSPPKKKPTNPTPCSHDTSREKPSTGLPRWRRDLPGGATAARPTRHPGSSWRPQKALPLPFGCGGLLTDLQPIRGTLQGPGGAGCELPPGPCQIRDPEGPRRGCSHVQPPARCPFPAPTWSGRGTGQSIPLLPNPSTS